MLVTLLRPTGGHARVAGFDVAEQPAQVRRRIGVALQEAALDPLMTGSELIELQATLHGIPPRAVARPRRRADRARRPQPGRRRRVGTYSGGMRRRLDLAMALIHEPEVLFLDEPTTGLDPTSRLTLWEEVRRLRDEGTTVFLTTQYLEEADQLADRLGIIAAGRIVAERHAGRAEGRGRPPAPGPHARRRLGPAAARARSSRRFGDHRPADRGLPPVGRRSSTAPPTSRRSCARSTTPGFAVAELELKQPTLDDVFLAKTGEHLEGAAEPEPAPDGRGRSLA